MVVVECSVPHCEFKTLDVSEDLAIALLTNHGLAHQNTAPTATASAPEPVLRGPKLDRPKVNVGVSTEEWNVFVRRWEVFRAGSRIDDSSAPSQLFQCAGPELGDSILKAKPDAASDSLPQLLENMRSLAVIPVATGVLRTELLQLRQERDETFRAFTARVRGKAETCAFAAVCECGKSVDYTNHAIRDVLLNCIYDMDIRREVLGTKAILKTPVNDVVSLVESKEIARNALPSSPSSSRQTPEQQPTTQATLATDPISQIAAFQTTAILRKRRHHYPRRGRATHATSGEKSHVVPDHHIFTKAEWKRARLRPHPRVSISISLDNSKPAKHCHNPSTANEQSIDISAIADTGAQSDLWSLDEFLAWGFCRDDLSPVSLKLSAANRSSISIEGAFFAKLTAKSRNGEKSSCRSMVYVSSSVNAMYLSYESLLNLGILSQIFTSADSPNGANHSNDMPHSTKNVQPVTSEVRSINEGCSTPCARREEPCSCPQREVTPLRPAKLPFPCTTDNNGRMKAWLLERYASSTFNTCPHRALPCMEGPPVEIHVDPGATPKACHTPATIPLHWQQRVHVDLLRDEALGVIEHVPYGEPVTWCHRMVVTRKHDGSPRRTVELSPLNKFCQRETFAMESPFHLARRIPKDTWKTVTDAWNGYHSVPLRQSDRHLTTFITPFGPWRYTGAPQGFLSSGDGYNRRFDAILSSFERKERCVDDTIHYDQTLTQHWWRTIDLLTRLGQAGIVLNPDKFQFAERSVDFAGFRVSDATIEPLPKYLDAIREFPSPTSTTDIRSWFGLVNQVSNYAQTRDLMAPFKPFLSPRCKFVWTPELEDAFQASKEAIIDAIRRREESFDLSRPTCLRPDWSKRGIGYFLFQKHCKCPASLPDCCPGGWRITLAGSRFLTAAEERYAAIEGEALAVAWGLEQTKYFTQGCDNLVIVTDHKPLTKIFGDRTLDEITNSQLFRLKQRTLPWRFNITHLPGKSNTAADAMSRHPSSSSCLRNSLTGKLTTQDAIEIAFTSSIRTEASELGIISWPCLVKETTVDPALSKLLKLVENDT